MLCCLEKGVRILNLINEEMEETGSFLLSHDFSGSMLNVASEADL